MSSRALFFLVETYSVIGIAVLFFLLILYAAGYHLLYRKLLKGQNRFPRHNIIWWGCLLFYAILVLGATLLFRVPSPEPEPVYPLFYSYWDAWIDWSMLAWRNIILNFCMFVPFGLLLSFGSKKLRAFWKILLAGFSFSLLIETLQLLLHRGMFELDDLLGNTTGALIGYGLFLLGDQLVRRIKKRPTHKKQVVLLAQLPLALTIFAFTVIFVSYHFIN